MPIKSGPFRWLFVMVLLVVSLSACGQKGDLYRSENNQSSIELTPSIYS